MAEIAQMKNKMDIVLKNVESAWLQLLTMHAFQRLLIPQYEDALLFLRQLFAILNCQHKRDGINNLIDIEPYIQLQMNHQISPWSIYDGQRQPSPKHKKAKTSQKRSSSFLQNTSLSASAQYQETYQIASACNVIDKQLQLLLSLKMIQVSIREEQNNNFCLPLIHKCLILKNNILKEKGFRSVSPSKESKKQLDELRDVYGLKRRKQNLSVLNYEPFDEEQIVTRGILQLLKIKERQLKMLSKHKIKNNKQ